MTITVTVTEAEVFQALGNFLTQILPAGTAIVRGQVNRVPEPQGTDFVVMWPILTTRLEYNTDTYDSTAQTKSMLQPVQMDIQLDVHGPSSADNSQIITTLMRDEYGTQSFTDICAAIGAGIEIQPLFCGNRSQMPFMDGEQQVEERWIIQVSLQANPVVVVPQQSALAVAVQLVSVDEAYPPV